MNAKTRLLDVPGVDDASLPPTCEAWIVGGIRHAHAAAKFWPRLIDEAAAAFPAHTRVVLETVTAERLDPVRLDPRAELQRDLDALADSSMEDVLRETMAELQLLGPPAGVRVWVLERDAERYDAPLPADSVDAETFIYLVAWLLEWARVPHATWTATVQDGQFIGEDRWGRRHYHVRFDIRRTPVREGLDRVAVHLNARVHSRPV